MLLKKLSEEDFAVLRGPLESGRQSPSHLGFILLLLIPFHALLFFLTYVVAADNTYYPNREEMFSVHFWITLIIVVFSLIYAIPAIYNRSQKMQYLLVILVSQNIFGVSFYIAALFLIFSPETGIHGESALTFIYVTLSFGALIFIATCIRFYILLHKGHYRKGTKKDQLRESVEGNIKSYLPMIIVASTGLVFVLQYLIRSSGFSELDTIIFVVIAFILFYAMLFVLPEQLVILYCKFRFKSFNFDVDENLLTEDDNQAGENASL